MRDFNTNYNLVKIYSNFDKDRFLDTFQIWLPKVENNLNYIIKAFCADDKREFIFMKLKNFCEIWDITFKYATPYIHKENGFAKRG